MSSTTIKSLCVQLKDEIEITDTEEQVFDRLTQVVHHYNLQTQLRVAGGWVRDKLLGKQSVDIDIALDNMMGEDFCQKVNEYSLFLGEKRQKIDIVESNPDKSKHLKTAVMEVFGIKVDFVNLRSEMYNQNSRIPRVEFGSPGEDAFRRDLTINSLFYNIKEKIIVTPLPPMVTFLDDPLRVFRAIRFAARFSFILDDGLREAAANEEVRNAIAGKISRERIGHEINLMLSGNRPVQAMMDICNLQLFWVVFAIPDNSEPVVPEGCDRLSVASVDAAWNVLKLRLLYLYSTLFLPVRDIVYRYGKGKKIPVTSYIIRESLGLTVSDVEMVKRLCRGSVVGEWQQKLLKWQLADPSRTSEQSLEYMRESLSKCSELD
ncbi:hypothetical protein MKX01_013311 [Papaver californicum]|nr:hypothetical protein MKX01_013311 [Papaver californicum]